MEVLVISCTFCVLLYFCSLLVLCCCFIYVFIYVFICYVCFNDLLVLIFMLTLTGIVIRSQHFVIVDIRSSYLYLSY